MFGSFGVSLTICLVRRHRAGRCRLRLADELLDRRRALRVEDDADPVVDERLARRRLERAREALAGALVGGAELRQLGLLLLRRHLGEVEAGERRAARRCPSASARRRASGRRSPCRSARRPAAPSRDPSTPARSSGPSRSSSRSSRSTGRRSRPAAAENVADAGAAGTDAEQHETAAEGDGEEDEHPLGVAPQPREEHRVLDRRRGRALGAPRSRYGSILLRALRAALVESGHRDVPFR